MASLGGAVGGGLAVLLMIGCLVARYRQKQGAKELEMKSMDTADKDCAFEEWGGKGKAMGDEGGEDDGDLNKFVFTKRGLRDSKDIFRERFASHRVQDDIDQDLEVPPLKPLDKTPIAFPLGTSLDHKPTGLLKARVDAVDGVVGGVTKEGSGAGGGAGRSAAAPHKQVSLEELFNLLDENGDGELGLQEAVAGSGKLGMTPAQARELFHRLDTDKSGTLTRSEFQDGGLAGLLGGTFGFVGDVGGAFISFANTSLERGGVRDSFAGFADTSSSFIFNHANTPASATTAAPANGNEEQGSGFFWNETTRSVDL